MKKISCNLNYDHLTDEKADFIYDTSKEFLLNAVDMTKRLLHKVILILGFAFSIMSLCASKIVLILSNSEQAANDFNNTLIWVLSLVIIEYAIIACVLFWRGLSPKHWSASGNEPANIIVQENINQSLAFMKLGEAINHQTKIDQNITENEKISSSIRFAAWSLVILPILSTAIIFAIPLFVRLFCWLSLLSAS